MKGDKEINIKFIDGDEQRYKTCGDYWETETSIEIRITKQVEDKRNLLVMLHEIVEYALCSNRNIKEEDITKYDLEWEDRLEPKADEPGNESDCIYKVEHRISENFERQFAEYLNIDWFDYENNLKI